MSARKTCTARKSTPTDRCIERNLARFGYQSGLLGVPWTYNGECGTNLVPILHLVKNRGPRCVLPQVRCISKDEEPMFSAGKGDIDTVRALEEDC